MSVYSILMGDYYVHPNLKGRLLLESGDEFSDEENGEEDIIC